MSSEPSNLTKHQPFWSKLVDRIRLYRQGPRYFKDYQYLQEVHQRTLEHNLREIEEKTKQLEELERLTTERFSLYLQEWLKKLIADQSYWERVFRAVLQRAPFLLENAVDEALAQLAEDPSHRYKLAKVLSEYINKNGVSLTLSFAKEGFAVPWKGLERVENPDEHINDYITEPFEE